jgi:hypothetical protein
LGLGPFLGRFARRHLKFLSMQPVNYKSLSLAGTHLRYVDLGGQAFEVAFNAIASIQFVREDAMFPDVDGPYLETKWNISTLDGSTVQVMDEGVHRRKLLRAFDRSVPGFDASAAATALASKEEGVWVCLASPPDPS